MQRQAWVRAAAAAVLMLAAATAIAAAQAPRVLTGAGAPAELRLVDVQSRGDGSVTATVKNDTNGSMRDVKLLVTHTWYWKDERHPGEDSPGRSAYVSLAEEIPPGGSAAFIYTPDPPLPQRADGSFQTTVAVQGFTQVGE